MANLNKRAENRERKLVEAEFSAIKIHSNSLPN